MNRIPQLRPYPIRTSVQTPARIVALALTALVVGATPPADAQSRDHPHWSVRIRALGLYPSSERTSFLLGAVSQTLEVDDGYGLGLELEYRASRRIGIEATYAAAEIDARFTLDTALMVLTDTESIDTEIASLGVNFHFTPQRRTDLYAGAFAAMSTFEDVIFLTESGLRFKRAFDDDIGFGGQIGLSMPLGRSERWSFDTRLRFLATLLEAENAKEGDLDLDLVMPSVGIGYRF